MSLHVEKYGNPEAENLVLIHGWGMHGGVWQPIVARLEQYFHLHIIDLPGMGFSPPLNHQFANEQTGALSSSKSNAIVDQVASVLPPQANVCGWSFGGQIAMQLVLQYPQRIKKLVLIGSTPKFVNATPVNTTPVDVRRNEQDAWPHGMDANIFMQFAASVRQDYQATLLKFLTLQCMRSSDAKTTIRLLRESFTSRPAPDAGSLQQGLELLLGNDFRQAIQDIAQPLLIVHGDRDTLAPVAAANWMASQRRGTELLVIPGASHAPFLSHPDEFIDALHRFITPGLHS